MTVSGPTLARPIHPITHCPLRQSNGIEGEALATSVGCFTIARIMRYRARIHWSFGAVCLSLAGCGDDPSGPNLVDVPSADMLGGIDASSTDAPRASDVSTADAPRASDASVPQGDGSVTCTAGQTLCGAYCADTSRDPLNCGACRMTCAAGAPCMGGRCGAPMTGDAGMPGPDGSLTCGAGLVACGAYCADTNRDPLNCGACGTRCTNQPCAAGRCGPTGGGDAGVRDAGGGGGDGGGGGGDGGGMTDVGVSCGRPGTMCCATEPRCVGSACVGGMCPAMTTCGMSGRACCAGAIPCQPGLTCTSGVCR